MNKYKTSNLFSRRLGSSRPFLYNNLLSFQYSFCGGDQYLYLMVGKKYGNAVSRNKLKRRLRSMYSNLLKNQHGLGLMVRPMQKNILFKDIQQAFEQLALKIQGRSN